METRYGYLTTGGNIADKDKGNGKFQDYPGGLKEKYLPDGQLTLLGLMIEGGIFPYSVGLEILSENINKIFLYA